MKEKNVHLDEETREDCSERRFESTGPLAAPFAGAAVPAREECLYV